MKILGIPEINGKVGEEEENGGAAGQLQRHALKNEQKLKKEWKGQKSIKKEEKRTRPRNFIWLIFFGFQSEITHLRVKILRCKK